MFMDGSTPGLEGARISLLVITAQQLAAQQAGRPLVFDVSDSHAKPKSAEAKNFFDQLLLIGKPRGMHATDLRTIVERAFGTSTARDSSITHRAEYNYAQGRLSTITLQARAGVWNGYLP